MRYSGKIGFARTVEKDTGIWDTDKIIERQYFGDVVKNYRHVTENNKINDDITMSNQFSIVGDQFAYEHFGRMRYITFGGFKWTITNVELQLPRLIISVGGLYNE